MLSHLSIQNFTLVERLDLDLKAGMTVITGETGTGKSVLLEALGQTLGDRADAARVRHGCKRADITATFELAHNPRAQSWLGDHDLAQPEAPSECLLRRTLTSEGRSKAYINGHPVTLGQLRALGEMLMDIHSQHEHQSLLIKDNHRRLLDDYADNNALVQAVKAAYDTWQQRADALRQRRDNAEELDARYQLIHYQVEELDQLDIQPEELTELEQEQRELTDAEALLQTSANVLSLCSDDEQGLRTGLNRALQMLRKLNTKPAALSEAEQLLNEAEIQLEEAQRSLAHFGDSFSLDPARLQWVEERLSSIYEVARKHRVAPEALPTVHTELAHELASLGGGEEQLAVMAQEVAELEREYRLQAGKLSKVRNKAATALANNVNAHLKALAMEHARLTVACNSREQRPSAHGLEDIELLISTNPGQPAAPLAKVASGGELSRVSLAIQVVVAERSAIASLVFDEVDVGIGGATADTVGRLLRQLAERGQILCVTHLAQVACKGHQHLRVEKTNHRHSAETTLVELTKQETIEELARMLGGATITDKSRAHAEQMLADA
jgi:DNA repair protein RecN (Recombination protein N)